jgi:hypothetical protein
MIKVITNLQDIVEERNAEFIDVFDELERIYHDMNSATNVTELAKLFLEARTQVDDWNAAIQKGKISLPDDITPSKTKRKNNDNNNGSGRSAPAEHSVKK